jgi:hypothetical protein
MSEIIHQLLPMKPVDTGRPIVGGHHVNQEAVSHVQSLLGRSWDGDVFLSQDDSRMLFVLGIPLARQEVGVLGGLLRLPVLVGRRQKLSRVPQSDAQRILVVELVDEIAGIAPREVVRGRGRRVKGLLFRVRIPVRVTVDVGGAAVEAARG